MLSHQDNETLIRVGPGTAMGEVMRYYWHPVVLSADLPDPDGKPMRIRLLGQNFVLFRNSDGVLGLLDEMCMHRGVSLALGRVEQGGLRCLYHGWKYGVDGKILETANYDNCRFREKLKANSYAVRESNGVVWVYIGPNEQQPPFRTFAVDERPDESKFAFKVYSRNNYLALWEGGLDSSHVSTLHTNTARLSWLADRGMAPAQGPTWAPMDDPAPDFAVADTPFGYHYVAVRKVPPSRPGGEELRNMRVTPAILPTGRIIKGPNLNFLVWETPVDDENSVSILIVYTDEGPISKEMIYTLLGIDDDRFWAEESPDFKGTWENDFFQDRAGMHCNYSGLTGIMVEDMSIVTSGGPLYDRSHEHLVPADLAVVKVRQKLMECVRLVKDGQRPIGTHVADLREVVAPDVDVPATTIWQDLVPSHQLLKAAE